MCSECAALLAEAETVVLLAEAEHTLILAEAEEGVNVADSRRPLFPHEVRAGVRFGDMNEALAESERQVTRLMTVYAERLVDAVLGLLPDGITPAQAAAVVARVSVDPPESVQKIIDDVTGEVVEVLSQVRNYGREAVASEAKHQGVEFTSLDDESYLKRVRDNVGEVAAGIAAALWLTVAGRVNRAVNAASAAVSKSAVKAATVGKSISKTIKDTIDQARQATHDQHNTGRRDGAALLPDPPARIYAGELLDGNTCDRCYAVDGYLFEDEAEAESWYPAGGPMRYCRGGKRCRGTLIYDWSNLEEEFDGGVDKDSAPYLPNIGD